MINASKNNSFTKNLIHRTVIGAVCLGILISGCETVKKEKMKEVTQSGNQVKLHPQATEIEKLSYYKNIWRTFENTHYSYSVYIECDCQFSTPHNVRETPRAMIHDKWLKIEIMQGKIVKIMLESGQESKNFKEKFLDTNPIDHLYERINDAISKSAKKISIQYDEERGFPRQLDIIFTYATDDTIHAEVKNFELLQ